MPENNDSQSVTGQLPSQLPRLWRFALMLSGKPDVAEDLVQSACLRAIERAHQFEPGSRLDRWLFAILASLWKNELRSRAIRNGGGLVDALEVADLAPDCDPERQMQMREVLTEVERLPEAQRETVFLVYVEGFSYAEAASILEIPPGTVMSRLAAARAALGRRLNGASVPGEGTKVQ